MEEGEGDGGGMRDCGAGDESTRAPSPGGNIFHDSKKIEKEKGTKVERGKDEKGWLFSIPKK